MLGRSFKIASLLMLIALAAEAQNHSRGHQADGARGIGDQLRHRQGGRQI
jgi:hypothetical protein